MKRSLPDIETAISFLCTRLKDPDINYWGIMIQVLQFLSQTMRNYRVIGVDNIYKVLTYVYTSYSTHDNIRSHTGGCMTFGWGLIHEKSSKHKLNTKISTDYEVVGASNYIPFRIWLAMHTEDQGYKGSLKKSGRIISAP